MSADNPKYFSKKQWLKILRGNPSKKDLMLFRQNIKIYEQLHGESNQNPV
jgi:hypothetical protein